MQDATAQQAYEAIVADKRCAADVLGGIEDPGQRRLVEIAMTATHTAIERDLDVRDALHKLQTTDASKARVAAFLCPAAATDWTGDTQHRMKARQASHDRQVERMNDTVIMNAAALHPDDWSAEALHLREVAASIREHREMAYRREAWAHEDAEKQALNAAVEAYAERDRLRSLYRAAEDLGEYQMAAGIHREAIDANTLGDRLTFASIDHQDEARHQFDMARQMRGYNERYEQAKAARGL